MINFFQRLVSGRGLPEIPDDDPSVERRYPKFPFVDHPTIRHMQRKCLMRAEHMRDHPELYPVSIDDRRRERVLREAKAPRAAGPSEPASEPFNFEGIEETAPVPVRLQLGDS